MSVICLKSQEFTVSHKNELYPVDQSLVTYARDFMSSGSFSPKSEARNGVRVATVGGRQPLTKSNKKTSKRR